MERKRGDIERKRGRDTENETNNEEREKRQKRDGMEGQNGREREVLGGDSDGVGVRVGVMTRQRSLHALRCPSLSMSTSSHV
jgi:hypothetical protein